VATSIDDNAADENLYKLFGEMSVIQYTRCLRNANHRINTVFFVVKLKYLLKVYGKIELRETINQST